MYSCLKTIVAVIALGASVASAQIRVQGAGATFPQPLYDTWRAEFHRAHPNIEIDYQGIGSGGGIKGITEKTIAFAGSDAPMNKDELAAVQNSVVEIPSCSGGVVPAYNVPGIPKDLKFTGPILAEIYLGVINKWNDAKLRQVNPGVNLPNLAITPAWRTDGSGTNYVFSNYLATQSKPFSQTVGTGKKVHWPLGEGGNGNAGVAAIVKQRRGAIGYLEQNYADKNNIPYGYVQNSAGKFVKASPQAVSLAGEGAVSQMQGTVLAANIWNQGGDKTYPIASFTYLIVYKDLRNISNAEQAQAVMDFLWWSTHDGEKLAAKLDYAPLSPGVQKKVEAALRTVTFKGQAITIANAQ